MLSLFFPLPNLPRTHKKFTCSAVSVHTSQDTTTLQNLFAICPATSGPSKLGGPWKQAASQQDRAQHLQLHRHLAPRSWKAEPGPGFRKPQRVLYPDATSIYFYCKTPTPSSASSLRNHKHPLKLGSNFNLIQAIGRQTQMLVWRWLWC